MRRVLFLSLALAALPLSRAFAQITPTPQSFPPPSPGPAAAPLSGQAGPGAPVPVPVAAPVPQAGVGISLQDDAFSHQESALQKQVEILKLQAQVADLQKKIADAQHPAQSVAAPVIVAPPRAMDPQAATDASGPATTTVAQVSVPTAPKHARAVSADHSLQLLGVVKVGSAAQATIADRGTPWRETVGAVLPSGWKVEAIEDTRVLVRRGRAHRWLTIGD